MTLRTRRIILCFVFLLFVFAAPAILFYSWGYGFDWQKKKPVLTGGFYFESIPKKAQIALNDKPSKETPVFIKRLLPGEYQVKITKDEFQPWQKKLKIESGLVGEARNILLIPLSPQIEVIDENLPDDFSLEKFLLQEKTNTDIFYIEKQNYILYKTNANNSAQEQICLTPLPAQEYSIIISSIQKISVLGENNEMYLLNPETKAFELIARDVQNVQFSSDNKKVLYSTPNEIWVYYLEDILGQPNKKARDKELITRLGEKIKNAVWYGKTNEHIIFSTGQTIKIAELDGRDERNITDIIKLNTDQIAYDPKKETILAVKNKKLIQISLK
ncbi:MAG: PEGA domain-containing protein [Candidatus Portnoybacteria bacterium]|nr:PEGA domain-containing protein [Candidatus Portnoybacteria bacterium]